MNVAELLSTRAAELSAFASLLFRKRPRSTDSAAEPTPLPRHARYRRPSSANTPVSRVARVAKIRATRSATRFGAAAEGAARRLRARGPSGEQCRLLLRRRRRMALRRRPVARRRRVRRAMALLRGKPQLPLCRCQALPEGSTMTREDDDDEKDEEKKEVEAVVDKGESRTETEEVMCSPHGRTALLWLPSHRQLSRRFHYRIEKIRLCAESGRETSGDVCGEGGGATVRLAVPVARRQKQHRVMQRFVARLPANSLVEATANTRAKPKRTSHSKETILPPPTCIASDRSAACVWLLEPRTPLSIADLAELLILRTSPGVMACSSSTRTAPDGVWGNANGSVLHGHMWAGSLVAPVILHCTPTRAGTFLLIAPVPVDMGRRVHAALSVRLVSHWNPCAAVPVRSSVFELWCADAARAVEWTQERVDAGLQRWRRAIATSVKNTKRVTKTKEMAKPKALTEGEVDMTVMVFPSTPQALAAIEPGGFPLHRCAHTVLLLTAPRRSSHFRLARHIFAALSSCAPAGPAGFAPAVRVAGEEERAALLRLAGCPVFPGDMPPNIRCVPSNAHQRVIVKFAARGGRVHQGEGSVLLALTAPAALSRVGFITSTPFFSMRFGCRIAHAWVWNDFGWEVSQRYLDTPRGADEKDSTEKPKEVVFFTCAVDRMRKLQSYMSNPPTRVSRRPRPRTEKKSCQLESALCDTDVCIAVELVRLGTTTPRL